MSQNNHHERLLESQRILQTMAEAERMVAGMVAKTEEFSDYELAKLKDRGERIKRMQTRLGTINDDPSIAKQIMKRMSSWWR